MASLFFSLSLSLSPSCPPEPEAEPPEPESLVVDAEADAPPATDPPGGLARSWAVTPATIASSIRWSSCIADTAGLVAPAAVVVLVVVPIVEGAVVPAADELFV